ncbi:Lrp/AsnC family transcriptional regulator [Gordonia liuliyuniae]|uniref:Lrp/AsnC family transcriptional regulator n=1 Tax=Gordonia liuliyuniae TaxID=2911517 RepID=A0ABS9IRM7_9ACTN|nr:Lrp/AsnC family transcriptional regulator [Gordonia liuliyuniae]MCF8588177.1 Lrp/AsnC family transcriptional regulator [Gordonia liuliyuniae]
MDAIDKKILSLLQEDGRISVTDLADRVGLSISPCHRRLKALESGGAVLGYHAQLDPAELGFAFEALVFVTMEAATRDALVAFEDAVVAVPHILHAQRLFGVPDYLLRVVAKDQSDYQELYDARLSSLPGVQKLTSTLVMKSVVDARALPL